MIMLLEKEKASSKCETTWRHRKHFHRRQSTASLSVIWHQQHPERLRKWCGRSFFLTHLWVFFEASRPSRPRRFFHQDTQQMVPTAIIQVQIFRQQKSKHLGFLSNDIHRPRNGNATAIVVQRRGHRVALELLGCLAVVTLQLLGIQGTLAHGDAELLLLFYKHTSEFRPEKERKTHKLLVSWNIGK